MRLEWDEINRAEEIKEAIQKTPGLDGVSDFWYAQYALVCKDIEGNVLMEDVIDRAEALQVFRQQYDIAESYQEGCRALRRFATLCPNFTLAFFYDTTKGNYTVIENPANFNAENFGPRERRDWMVGYYYIHLASTSDFQAIHMGGNVRVECKNMGWSKRHNLKLIHKAATECWSFVPMKISSVQFYNTGIGGAAFNTMRRAIDKGLAQVSDDQWPEERVDIAVTYSEGLDSVLLAPDASTALERTLRNVEEGLRLRFENERKFSLGQGNYKDICPITDDVVDAIFEARSLS